MELRLIFQLLRRWVWLLIIGALVGLAVGSLINYYQTPVYRASTKLMITGELNELDQTNQRQTLQELVGTYTQLLSTRSIPTLAAAQLGYEVQPDRIRVNAIPNTKLFQLTYESQSAQQAAETANVLVEVLIEQNEALQSNRVTLSASGLQAQIEQVEEQIRTLEQQVALSYQTTREERREELTGQIERLDGEITQLQDEIFTISAQDTGFDETGRALPLPPEQQFLLQQRQAELADLQSQLSRFEDAYFELTVLGQADLAQGTVEEIQLVQSQTQLQSYRDLYSDLLSEYEVARMTTLNAIPTVVQVDPAVPPRVPIWPRPTTTLIFSATIGVILAGFLAFAYEYIDDSIKSAEGLDRLFGAPVLGHIMNDRNAFKSEDIHVLQAPRSPVAESLRSLRTNLEFVRGASPVKTMLVTSTNPAEGKTTIVANLAAVVAQAGKKVIVIDADLRRPNLHNYFHISNKFGLTNVLADQVKLAEVMQAGGDSNIHILTSGPIPPNPVELLSSPQMASLLQEAGQLADLVIIDGPPAIVADSAVLASQVDGVLPVVRFGHTRITMVKAMMEQFRHANARILGVVLNRIKTRAGDYYGRYYHYQHDYSAENGRRKSARSHSRWFSRKEEAAGPVGTTQAK